jgi:hypothetical protein
MQEKLTSEGKCIYCNEMVKGRSMNTHLKKHLNALSSETKKKAYHLAIEAKPYFLYILIDGGAKIGLLDEFLRDIWLECCGHLSTFMSGGRFGEEVGMGKKIEKVFNKFDSLDYRYDFGSTTELQIKCVNVYTIETEESIQLLSRNEPLAILCDNCGKKPAESMCSVHGYDEDAYFCKTCSKKHEKVCEDFADYAELPVVNSPRMGACAYDGGVIDTERDGVFQLKK